MDTERWRRLEAYFDEALALPPESRAAFVERVTVGDAELRNELLSLLKANESASTFLEDPAQSVGDAAPTGETLAIATRLGAWRIVRLIGRGRTAIWRSWLLRGATRPRL